MSKRTVYAVSSGEYSDYGVDCLFEKREDAEAYVVAANSAWSGHRVEEFVLWDEPLRAVAYLQIEAYFDPATGEPRGEPSEQNRIATDSENNSPTVSSAKHVVYGWTDRIFLKIEGTEPERVRKVYSEQAAQIRANPAAFARK